MTSIHLSYAITLYITKCHDYSFDLKLVYLLTFHDFSVIFFFNIFIKIHEYAN